MTDEYRDTEEVLMIIRKAAMFVDPIMKISARGLPRTNRIILILVSTLLYPITPYPI